MISRDFIHRTTAVVAIAAASTSASTRSRSSSLAPTSRRTRSSTSAPSRVSSRRAIVRASATRWTSSASRSAGGWQAGHLDGADRDA